MALFRKKKTNEYDNASKSLNETIGLARDRVIFEQLENNDYRARELVFKLREGCPLILSFELLGQLDANKLVAFFTGATVACDGQIVPIKESVYLFARTVDFKDGSLYELVNEI